jgi:hypothetical protein
MKKEISFLENTLPQLDPIIAIESDETGWRGLTVNGEILEVRSANGHKAEVPSDDVLIMRAGKPVGRRAIEPRDDIRIDEYLNHYNAARDLHCANKFEEALVQATKAISIAPTWCARFNHSQILLANGLWPEGFAEYALCECEPIFQRPNTRKALAAGLRPWLGQPLARTKRLLLIHDHGFGDTIMMLRYAKELRRRGVDVVLMMPPELERLAQQCAPVVGEIVEADYFCTMFGVLSLLNVTPETVLMDTPYLAADDPRHHHWRGYSRKRKRIGVAWSVGKFVDGEYPREIPLQLLVEKFGGEADLISLQIQDGEQADALGVQHFVKDFDEVATLMMTLEQIISVDTAALHLAGAIGHPDVTALLSHWHSWRWQAPWYPRMRFCRQTASGDWASALVQVP